MDMTESGSSIQCLTFRLGEEIYAVEVAKVKSVLDLIKITKVPRTPDFMRGVINLRGSVVPIIDFRLKLGMAKTEQTLDTCIIVLEVGFEGQILELGALADAVHEVIELNSDMIEPPPTIGTKLNTEFIKGMGKQKEDFIIILDIDKVFSAEELSLFNQENVLESKEKTEEVIDG